MRRYDEITDHVDRVKYEQVEFANGTPPNFHSHRVMDRFIAYSITSVVLNTVVVFISLFVYLFMTNTDFSDKRSAPYFQARRPQRPRLNDRPSENSCTGTQEIMRRWWSWTRWAVLLAVDLRVELLKSVRPNLRSQVTALIGATLSFYISLYYLIVIKVPDYFCRKNGYSGGVFFEPEPDFSPYGFTNRMQSVVIIGGIMGTCMPASRHPQATSTPLPRIHAGCSASLLDSCASFVWSRSRAAAPAPETKREPAFSLLGV